MPSTTISDIDPRKITPEEAMCLPDEQKRIYFDRVRFAHPKVTDTLRKLDRLTPPTSGRNLVLLVGPTGVGKSTLVSSLGEKTFKILEEEIGRDPEFVPAVRMVVPASGERQFAWKMFYQALGDALDEPLMDRKLETRTRDGRVTVWQPGSKSSVTGMREAVVKALVRRRTRLVILDEAAPLFRATGDTLDRHMDALKTLADTGAKLILVGSYDLYRLANRDAQITRRMGTAHFSRYLSDVPEDAAAFRTMVGHLQRHLPLRDVPDLRERALMLQDACVGCIGILKTVLATALECALANGGRWSDAFLEESLLSQDAFKTILIETMQGEALVEPSALGNGSFQALLEKGEELKLLRGRTA